MSDLPPLFRALLLRAGLPLPEREVRFHPTRKWRWDMAWTAHKVALEIQGGLWVPGGGRHQRGAALLREYEKLNTAAVLGWRILYTTPQQLATPATITLIRGALDA